jgi:hypothetical protein
VPQLSRWGRAPCRSAAAHRWLIQQARSCMLPLLSKRIASRPGCSLDAPRGHSLTAANRLQWRTAPGEALLQHRARGKARQTAARRAAASCSQATSRRGSTPWAVVRRAVAGQAGSAGMDTHGSVTSTSLARTQAATLAPVGTTTMLESQRQHQHRNRHRLLQGPATTPAQVAVRRVTLLESRCTHPAP